MTTTPVILASFAMFAFFTAAAFMLVRDWHVGRRMAVERRLRGADDAVVIPRLPVYDESRNADLIQRFDRWFYRLIGESGITWDAETAFLSSIALGTLIGGGLFLWREELFLAITGFLAGMVVVMIAFTVLRWRRLRTIREQLPEAVDMIARAVRAGESVDQAIHATGLRAQNPLGLEVRRLARQLDMGLSLDAAMQALTRRVPINEVRILAATFMVQRRAGGNLPVTLERLARVIRDRLSYYRQFRAATAASRIGALLIAAAGPVAAIVILNLEPDYFATFLEYRMGIILLCVAIVLQLIGIIWIFRLLHTDY